MELIYIHIFTYWGLSIFFFILDYICYKTETVEKYKKNKITKKYWNYCYDSAKSALYNQIFVTLPILYYINYYSNIIFYDYYTFINEIYKFLFYIFCIDIWFFTFHYLFHKIPFLYQKIHKFHHRESIPSAVSALDAHIIEHLLINISSILIGPILWPGYYLTIYFYIFLTTANSCISHSGYKNYLVGEEHNIHHKMTKYNYGIGLYLLDKLFGTYKKDINIEVCDIQFLKHH